MTDARRHLLALALLLLCGVLLWTSERGRSPTADEPLHLIRGHALWWQHDSRLSFAHPPLANAITSLPAAASGSEPWGHGATPDGTPREPPPEPEPKPEPKPGPKLGPTGAPAPDAALSPAPEPKPGPQPSMTRAEALAAMPDWERANHKELARDYFQHDYRRARDELIAGRRMMMLWTLALGLFLYVWVDRRWGGTAALVSLSLYSLHPTLLAHGRLVTTDMPLAATVLFSLAALIAWIERPGWGRAALFGLATTAMVLGKHSGVPFVVVMSAMLLGAAALGRGGFATLPGSRTRHVLISFVQLSLVAVFMIFMLDAIYLFDRVGLRVDELLVEPEPDSWVSDKRDFGLLAHSPVGKLPDSLPIPFPFTWLVGLATVSEQNAMGHGRWFFGPRRSAGHPLYFPVMLIAKSPTGLLVLIGIGVSMIVAQLRARWRPGVAGWVLLIFASIELASACASRINLGVRHVLPLLPIMIVFAGYSAARLLEPERPAGVPRWLASIRRRRALVLGCVLGSAIGAGSTFPNWLSDFSLVVGGPYGGHKISVTGEDWGQDLGDLADYAKDQGWTAIAYHSDFIVRTEELQSHGLEVHKFRCKETYRGPEPVVVHLSDWERRRHCFAWLRERTPDHVVNHHMLVFEPREIEEEPVAVEPLPKPVPKPIHKKPIRRKSTATTKPATTSKPIGTAKPTTKSAPKPTSTKTTSKSSKSTKSAPKPTDTTSGGANAPDPSAP